MSPNILRRTGAIALSGAVAAGLTLAGPAAHAATDHRPANMAAGWLAGELVDGALQSSFGGPDWGLTIDAGLAFEEVGGHEAELSSIAAAVEGHVADYVTGDSFGDADSTYSKATAKAAYFAESVGADPTAFGGDDLMTRLGATLQASGRIKDISAYGDYANVIGQAFAARVLVDQASSSAGAALSFLLSQQCAAGWFRQDFTHVGADPANFDPGTATDAPCSAGADVESTPSVDTTALTVMLLEPLAGTDQDIAAALSGAVDWLQSAQRTNGSFDDGGDIGPNANSTSVAAWALRVAGADSAAARAATWVRALQIGETACDGAATVDEGAVAYTAADYKAAVAGGVTDRAKFDRVATQAVPALLAAPAATTNLKLGGAPSFLDGGTKQKLSPSGLAPGERGCASIGGNHRSVVGDADGAATVLVPVPDRTKQVTVAIEVVGQAVGTPRVALAAKRLPVDLRQRVQPGGTQRVVVDGLWPGESVVVKNAGDLVARGRAAEDGSFVAKFPVARKAGSCEVAVRGQFGDRHGSTSYQVG
ncbi:hypothetical protein [Nocardioides panacisoli]|uniref:Terpene cyclase/mutase family protein n=1 Tax=Nocardioides panacisoli TaxID=627624 RepID=A0ABP7I525_9ACTN